MDKQYIDTFFAAYVECALWLALESNGDELREPKGPVDESVLTAAQLADMRADCEAFIAENAADLAALSASQCGHDFFLTRNGHGAGFWDRGLGAIGDKLTAACKPFGAQTIIIYDNGISADLIA